MTLPARRLSLPNLPRFALAIWVGLAMALAGALPASAQGLFSQPRYAAIVVDAQSGEVLYSKRADAQRFPASISKIMTLYLTFEALQTGRLSLNDQITVSAHANNMMPSKSQLRPGDSLSVDEAIRIVAVHSANDIAVALAERIGGSEERFAALMTLRAHELGMNNTRFVNASGVPDERQLSTARDIAILCRAVMRDYPQDYSYFGLRSMELRGKEFTNHNHLLNVAGMDGFKTGYTYAAGFNLAASQVRDGRRLITVVLGGSSAALRDDNVETLMSAGFDVLRRRQMGQNITLASIADPEDASGPIERPSIEQGDGDQPSMKVEMADSLRGPSGTPYQVYAHPIAQRAQPTLRAAIDAEDCGPASHKAKGKHARPVARRAACAHQTAVLASARDCTRLKGAKHRACEHEMAAAAPCAHKAGKAKRTCEHKASQQVAASSDDEAPLRGGRYLIQVGAYKSRGEARSQVAKLSARYGSMVGEGQVESGGGGYRARFKGMSSAEAKAACRKLAAGGQRCMVMATS